MSRPSIWLVLILIVCFGVSCDPPHYIFEKSQTFSKASPWLFSDSFNCEFTIKDTNRYYNLLLEVDHNKEYAFENLYVKFNTTYPDKTLKSDVVSLQLSDESGEWHSDCRGKICTFYLTLQEQAIFSAAGTYNITIYPWMRQDTLEDIYRVDFKVERDEKREKAN